MELEPEPEPELEPEPEPEPEQSLAELVRRCKSLYTQLSRHSVGSATKTDLAELEQAADAALLASGGPQPFAALCKGWLALQHGQPEVAEATLERGLVQLRRAGKSGKTASEMERLLSLSHDMNMQDSKSELGRTLSARERARAAAAAIAEHDAQSEERALRAELGKESVMGDTITVGGAVRQGRARLLQLPPPQALLRLQAAAESPPQSVGALQEVFGAESAPAGLQSLLESDADFHGRFFSSTLPYTVALALRLPELAAACQIPMLEQGSSAVAKLPRLVVASLLANQLLCTFPDEGADEMNACTMAQLLEAEHQPQELAKLRMFIHFFERLAQAAPAEPTGFLYIRRSFVLLPAGQNQEDDTLGDASVWAGCTAPLTTLVLESAGGIEDAIGCLQVDFANEYLGGGVLSGGCVQEEIRFAVSPECTVGLLLCPRMLDHEAIVITGAEQFSRYTGYGYSLGHGGDFVDPTPRGPDGTFSRALAVQELVFGHAIEHMHPLGRLELMWLTQPPLLRAGTVQTAIVAIDATPWAGSVEDQFRQENMLRELGKAFAGFCDHGGEASTAAFATIATGNWGCGAFGGYVDLKAVLQWMAASMAGRPVQYYSFQDPVHERLEQLAMAVQAAPSGAVTVAWLWKKLVEFPLVMLQADEAPEFITWLITQVLALDGGGTPRA